MNHPLWTVAAHLHCACVLPLKGIHHPLSCLHSESNIFFFLLSRMVSQSQQQSHCHYSLLLRFCLWEHQSSRCLLFPLFPLFLPLHPFSCWLFLSSSLIQSTICSTHSEHYLSQGVKEAGLVFNHPQNAICIYHCNVYLCLSLYCSCLPDIIVFNPSLSFYILLLTCV